MSRINLTLDRIEGLSCKKGQTFLWDSTVPGLGVRATPSGKKTYILQSRIAGKVIRMTIGDVGAWLLDNKSMDKPGARQEARRLMGLIDKGIDPRLHKKEQEEKNKQTEKVIQQQKKRELIQDRKVSVMWDEYIIERKPHWGERHYLDHIRLSQSGGDKVKRGKGRKKPGPLYPLMKIKLADFTTKKIVAWLKKEAAHRPGQTRLAYSHLKAFINWCAEHSDYKAVISSDVLPRKIAEILPKKKPKSDSLQREQLESWFSSVKKINNPVISAYLQALLITGARREELAGLRWEDCDL